MKNDRSGHEVRVRTGDVEQAIAIPPKSSGPGSAVNGGELLFLALATCYCNDIYREAARRKLAVDAVEVEVTGEFGAPGESARNVAYHVRIAGAASEAELRDLCAHTDTVAEIHNTLRAATAVTLASVEVGTSGPHESR